MKLLDEDLPPYQLPSKYNENNMTVPSDQFQNYYFDEAVLYTYLLKYVVDFDTRRREGYPIMDDKNPGSAIIVNRSRRYSRVQPMNMETCDRCRKVIPITRMNMPLPEEHCFYHWGKFRKLDGYSCCKQKNYSSVGCSKDNFHIWNGLRKGVNGPIPGFVSTPNLTKIQYSGSNGIFAIDCEMCHTTAGLELARVSVINWDGSLIYDTIVCPENDVIDFNTRFSGITLEMFQSSSKKTLSEVQIDLTSFINSSSLIIGHGLENDLKVLKLLHTMVVDTAISFNHVKGLPFRYSLKDLAENVLNRDIRPNNYGHNSLDDARAAMDLILWKVQNDFPHF